MIFDNVLYHSVKFYIKTGLFLFYKKISVKGKENIPKTGPILFIANHQNAMMDPLIVATSTNKTLYFLARASAFKNKIGAKLLNAIHAIAIYRVRDGVNSTELNKVVFKNCLKVLNDNHSILIFPEGSHNIRHKVRSLRKGFTKIAFDYIKENSNKELHIVPVGINYSNKTGYASEVTILYGKPILASNFYNEADINKSIGDLIQKAHNQLKSVTVHIDDDTNYDTILSQLTDQELLNPTQTNKKISELISINLKLHFSKSKKKNIFYYLMMINSILPFLVWKWLHPKIKEIEFTSTAKFSLGLTVFPLFYFVQTILIWFYFGINFAFAYVLLCFALVYMSSKTR
jgi:1-acyl-sn-glycerol-3-phosphate acyltransferase